MGEIGYWEIVSYTSNTALRFRAYILPLQDYTGTFRINIDKAIAGGISDAGNGKIFNMLALINVGERSGSGLCDVYNVRKENGFKRPELMESVNPDRVTLMLEINVNNNQTASNAVVSDVNHSILNC